MALLVSAGCGDEKAAQRATDVEDGKRSFQMLNAEKNSLMEQISQLRTDCAELQSEYDDLKAKETELAQWSLQVAERFGPGVWYYSKNERPLPYKSIPNASPDLLISELNALFRQSRLPQITLIKTNGNTAHVQISDDWQLTQQMGSAGATGYIQAVTYTLTSLPGIDDVDFDFEEGDHAVPGRYAR